jgi:hypothetical protein
MYAIGIGSAVDSATLSAFDTATYARMLFDAGQLAAALAVLAHSDFSSVLSGQPTESPSDALDVHDHSAVAGAAPEDAPPHHAASGETEKGAASIDDSLLSQLGGDLLEDDSELLLDDSFSSMPQAPATEARHASLGDSHLDLRDLFGEDATVDYLLSRVSASQETRTVNGETIEHLVLHIHAGDDTMTPIVHTIVFEGLTQADSETPDDLRSLLQQLLQT